MASPELRGRIPVSLREITSLHRDAFTFREHGRRSEVSAETEPGRKAGTDQGTTVARPWLREFQKVSTRRSPSGSLREVRSRSVKASHFYPFPLEKSPRLPREREQRQRRFVRFDLFFWFIAQGNQIDQRNQMNQRDEQEAVFIRERLALLDELHEIAFSATERSWRSESSSHAIPWFLLHVLVRLAMSGLSYYPYYYPYSRVTTLTPQVTPSRCRTLALASDFACRFQIGE